MSFNTFCGQDPANAATYNRVLLRFQEGGGGGGIAAVNQGPNITIVNPAVPVVEVANPLNATLNFGLQSLTDSAGNIGAIGEVLGCGAAGGQTLWGLPPAAAPTVNTTNLNATFYPTFVTAGGGVPRQLYADDGVTPISVNPNTGDFNVVDTVIITQSQLSVGKGAGAVGQGLGAVAIGFGAANNNQGAGGVAIGLDASTGAFQGASAVAIGANAAGDPLNSQGNSAVAIGFQAGFTSQGAGAIAIGEDAGNTTQSAGAVAVGDAAGNITQGADAVAIGTNAGLTNQGAYSVAIGINSGTTQQGGDSIAIGNQAGQTTQGANAIAIGGGAGQTTQGGDTVAIGTSAGITSQGGNAVAIGTSAGGTNQAPNAVAVGNAAGGTNQSAAAIAIGENAGSNTQGQDSVAIGTTAGGTNQGASSVAIGISAGRTNQGVTAVAIGNGAGLNTQSNDAVAIGNAAGQTTQGNVSIAIGLNAGTNNQGGSSIAMGDSAGTQNQGASCVAIGASSGQFTQGNGGNSCVAIGIASGQTTQGNAAIAVGYQAGQNNQGASAIAIGLDAATLNQSANSICLNASGAALQAPTASLYVAPIINSGAIANPVPLATNFLLYNPATAEVTYGDGAGIGGGGGGASVNVINCVPWGYELGITGSTAPIKSSTSAEFMFNNFSTTVGNLYDITGTAPNTVPPFYQDAVFCTCFVNCVIPEVAFAPALPFSAGGNGNILNQDGGSASVLPFQDGAATQVLWHFGYILNPASGGTFQDFATPTFASSPVLNFPELALLFSPPIGNKFHSSVSMTGTLDITGMNPADVIQFQLQAYTNVSTSQIDTSTTTNGAQGHINVMCRPVRNP